MDIAGSFALLLAFLAAVYAFVAGIIGILTRRTLITKSARNAGMAVFFLVAFAVGTLVFTRFAAAQRITKIFPSGVLCA